MPSDAYREKQKIFLRLNLDSIFAIPVKDLRRMAFDCPHCQTELIVDLKSEFPKQSATSQSTLQSVGMIECPDLWLPTDRLVIHLSIRKQRRIWNGCPGRGRHTCGRMRRTPSQISGRYRWPAS